MCSAGACRRWKACGPRISASTAWSRRVAAGGIDEVVLAMNATLEGQTTAHYLAERLEKFPIRLTQLAHGLPVGGELDYLDEGTLAQALRARRPDRLTASGGFGQLRILEDRLGVERDFQCRRTHPNRGIGARMSIGWPFMSPVWWTL